MNSMYCIILGIYLKYGTELQVMLVKLLYEQESDHTLTELSGGPHTKIYLRISFML